MYYRIRGAGCQWAGAPRPEREAAALKTEKIWSPCDGGEILALWSAVFGEAEAALEAPQIDGSEADENEDFLYVIRDAGRLAGTIHATIPRAAPTLCGLSGMCVAPEYRGRGLARQLFGAMVEDLDGAGVEAAFLGTDNPVAARLYAGFGFAFLPGSNVMARFLRGSALEYGRRAFLRPRERFATRPFSPAMRIPMIPLALHRGSQFLLDCNAEIFTSAAVTQRSCMGLYPKYESMLRRGGGGYCAWAEDGVLGTIASVKMTGEGPRADFFGCDAFLPAVPELLERCRAQFGPLRFQIAAVDAGKRACVERLGCRPGETAPVAFGRVCVPCVTYEM